MSGHRTKTRNNGFTVIEVMIVLAVATLLLIIVFTAVPSLQRNARNNGRTSDITKLSSALSEYRANNNGVPPASCDNTQANCFVNGAKLTAYEGKSIVYTALAAPNNYGPLINTDAVRIYNYMKCDPNYDWAADGYRTQASGHMAKPTGAGPQNFVALYAIEGSGGATGKCKDI